MPVARPALKDVVRRGASRLGVEEQARDLWRRAHPALRRDFADRAHLRRLIAWTVAADAHCVDIGAHEGDVIADLVRAAPHGRHVAYEPLPWLAASLASRFPDVDVRARALSDAAGTRSFTHVVGNPGWSGFRRRPTPGASGFETLDVPVDRLDDALPEGFRPAFVKLDVEGAELEVLRGALETLRACRPVVAFEHGLGSADHYGTDPGDVFALLVDRAGLRIFDLDGAGPYDLERFRTAFHERERVNFVAHP